MLPVRGCSAAHLGLTRSILECVCLLLAVVNAVDLAGGGNVGSVFGCRDAVSIGFNAVDWCPAQSRCWMLDVGYYALIEGNKEQAG